MPKQIVLTAELIKAEEGGYEAQDRKLEMTI